MKRKSSFKARVEYAAAYLVIGFLSYLPRGAAVRIGIVAGRLAYRILGGQRRVAMRNLELAFPEKPSKERLEIAKNSFENLGRVLGEVSQFRKATPESIRSLVEIKFDDESRRLYEKVKAEKRGVLIVTGHMGNWELLVMAFAVQHEPISYLARPLDNHLLENATVAMRSRFGNRPISKRNSAMLAISILREGGFLGILADVNAHPKEGVFVPFFGIPACTASGAAMIAIRSNSLIFPAFCVWDIKEGRYTFVRGAVIEPVDSGNRKEDIVAITAAYTREIEKVIRDYPDQWMWIHKRWKTRPPGEESIY
jgi:Kdo2-lipid IVA lauroyltransferase/acyltransferase